MKRLLQILTVSLGLIVVLAPTASAAGSEWMGGTAYYAPTYYSNPRRVTNPSLPGAEVAFNQATGNPHLILGVNNCSGAPLSSTSYLQTIGVWRPVAHFSVPTTFCVTTQASTGAFSFTGTLAWD